MHPGRETLEQVPLASRDPDPLKPLQLLPSYVMGEKPLLKAANLSLSIQDRALVLPLFVFNS